MSGMVIPSGNIVFSKSARSTLGFKFSRTKYKFLQSPYRKVVSLVRFPLSVPSSKGTQTMMATSSASQTWNY